MIKNYIKTAWRSLMRNKSYAAINITGLAVGIAACMLIFMVVQFETSFDNFHTNKDRIYRVITSFHGPDGVDFNSGTSGRVWASQVQRPDLKRSNRNEETVIED